MDLFHVLNRGVDKRKVFMDDSDRARFIHDLWEFNDIAPASHNTKTSTRYGGDEGYRNIGDVGRPLLLRIQSPLVKIHFFCLMPNHYHLLVSPINDDMGNLSLFMKKLNGGYSKYFNEKYERTGALWQGKYKSVRIQTDAHFLYIPYYIHFNALDLKYPAWRTQCLTNPQLAIDFLKTYRWSSHLDYSGEKNFPSVTDRKFFLNYFEGEKGYVRSIARTLKSISLNEELSEVTLE